MTIVIEVYAPVRAHAQTQAISDNKTCKTTNITIINKQTKQ